MEYLFNSTATLAVLDEIVRSGNTSVEGLIQVLCPNVLKKAYLPLKLSDMVRRGLIRKRNNEYLATPEGKEVYLDEFFNIIQPILSDFGVEVDEKQLINQ